MEKSAPITLKIRKPNPEKLLEIFNNDLELMDFFNEWSTNGHNATKAYLRFHPNCTEKSASVLGARVLGKVNKAEIMREFGLDENAYFKQLNDGLNATKWNDFTGDREPDHKTRLPYHDKVGRMLGIESEQQPNQTNVQVNISEAMNKL